jgi:hypothetical protein
MRIEKGINIYTYTYKTLITWEDRFLLKDATFSMLGSSFVCVSEK